MLGIVPLVNIPFDWVSLGATRALLRRGCEEGALSPLWLGLIDIVIGIVLLILLAAALIAALQLVDYLTLRGSGRALIGVPARLAALGQHPTDAGNYWIYFTLFSTMISSVINLGIGADSLVTFLSPKRRAWMIREIPRLAEKGTEGTRRRIVAWLAFFAGAGTLGTGLVVWGVAEAVIHFAPWVLTGFLHGAQWWAAALSPMG